MYKKRYQKWEQALSFNAGSMPMHHPHPPPTTQRIDNHNFVLIGLAWQWSAAVLGHTVQQCNTKIQTLHRASGRISVLFLLVVHVVT